MIVFPDAEALMVDALQAPGITVSTSRPEAGEDRHIRVVRVGGTQRDIVTDRPLLVLECSASYEVAASDLAYRTRSRAMDLAKTTVSGEWIATVEAVGGPTWSPDPDRDFPRYLVNIQMSTRGRESN